MGEPSNRLLRKDGMMLLEGKEFLEGILVSRARGKTFTNRVVCQPVVPLQTQRSWFGVAPDGADSSF